jgi:hypothetical protein
MAQTNKRNFNMQRDLIIKLGSGNTLVVHDIDLEKDGQAWYEELTPEQAPSAKVEPINQPES